MVKSKKRNLKIIVGLGKTGFSCIKYLVKQGCQIAVIDSRANPSCLDEFKTNFAEIPHFFGSFRAPFLDQACELIVSPGVSLREPAIAAQIAKGVPAIGDIELFARTAKVPIIAVTGSNGKSTVTSLVGRMAQAAGINVKVGGNLGIPALDLLDAKAQLYVLELSSFQLETTYSLAPQVAVILNVSEDHMDRYANFTEYLAAKQRIYRNCKFAVVNRDDPASYAGLQLPKIISFGLNKPGVGEFGLIDNYLAYEQEKLLSINDLCIKGLHQVANALAALALGHAINLPFSAMLEALRNFSGLAHRCQWVAKINDVDWYNDSKATNVGAAKAAIEGLGASIKGKLILIAGGIGKDANFTSLCNSVTKYVRTLVLIGQDAKKIAKALDNSCKILFANSMQDAIKMSQTEAQSGDAVLLSPACASFDMFNDFEHRGEVFMKLVNLTHGGHVLICDFC